jgi:hypothetical protein
MVVGCLLHRIPSDSEWVRSDGRRRMIWGQKAGKVRTGGQPPVASAEIVASSMHAPAPAPDRSIRWMGNSLRCSYMRPHATEQGICRWFPLHMRLLNLLGSCGRCTDNACMPVLSMPIQLHRRRVCTVSCAGMDPSSWVRGHASACTHPSSSNNNLLLGPKIDRSIPIDVVVSAKLERVNGAQRVYS